MAEVAARTRRMRRVSKPEFVVMRSLVIVTNALPLLWRGQQPDWDSSYRLSWDKFDWVDLNICLCESNCFFFQK